MYWMHKAELISLTPNFYFFQWNLHPTIKAITIQHNYHHKHDEEKTLCYFHLDSMERPDFFVWFDSRTSINSLHVSHIIFSLSTVISIYSTLFSPDSKVYQLFQLYWSFHSSIFLPASFLPLGLYSHNSCYLGWFLLFSVLNSQIKLFFLYKAFPDWYNQRGKCCC